MKTKNKLLSVIAALICGTMLVGCASDPLTKTLKQYGYVAAIPAPATQHIGNIYDTADLKDPYALMRDLFSADDNETLMKSLKDDVSIPNSSEESKFKIRAEADIIGKAKVELSASGVTKFSVSFGGVSQYIVSKTKFEDEIYPKIKTKLSERRFDKKYVVVALLQISTFEYEFYNEHGGKVDITPGSELEKVLKAKIGAEWSANQKSNLSISSPRFIGYRLARLTHEGFDLALGPKFMALDTSIKVQDIPLEDLRGAAR